MTRAEIIEEPIERQIAAHIAWMAQMDPAYAKWARGNFWAMLSPFLAKSRGH